MNKSERGINREFRTFANSNLCDKARYSFSQKGTRIWINVSLLLMEFPLADKHARIVQLRAQIKMLCDLQRNNVKRSTKAAALRMRVGQAASP